MAPKISFRALPGPDIIDESALFNSPASMSRDLLAGVGRPAFSAGVGGRAARSSLAIGLVLGVARPSAAAAASPGVGRWAVVSEDGAHSR